MNSVGIDVPKRKSMIAVMRPSGEEGVSPIENQHTDGELSLLRGLPRETCVVMESTGNYHLPVSLTAECLRILCFGSQRSAGA